MPDTLNNLPTERTSPSGPAQTHSIPAAVFLERALLFTFAAHGLGMLSLLALLLPGLPGGSNPNAIDRMAFIASHPWLWRLGWLPWQITALSDILLAIALLRTPWIPRAPAITTFILTCIAILPDQIGQAIWITRGVDLAANAIRTHHLAPYLAFESSIYRVVSAWAALLYTMGAIGWTWCFVAAGTWNRRLTVISALAWPIFLFAAIGPLMQVGMQPSAALVGLGNAIGFLLLEWWFLEALELVLRRSRPDTVCGRFMVCRPHGPGLAPAIAAAAANSRTLHYLCDLIPSVPFESEITDVIYVNYLAEADRLSEFVPEGLEMQRLGPEGRYALFSHLTYRHGRVGPAFAHRVRFAPLPSPIQSNWRIHVTNPRTGLSGIHFVANAASGVIVPLGARLMLQSMPMHALAESDLSRTTDGCFHLQLSPGNGSGPDIDATLCPTNERTLAAPWKTCFEDYNAFLEYCVPQNRAMASQLWHRRISRQEIQLDIPIEDCSPLSGEVRSRMAEEIAGKNQPICFYVPKVTFRFDKQEFDPLT